MTGKNLVRLRVVLASFLFTGMCLLFLESIGVSFLASWQLGSALLAGSLVVLIVLAALTIALGRIYCAAFCPLGILQDLLARINPRAKYRPLAAFFPLRLAIMLLFLASILAGIPIIFAVLDPYSAFGRIAANLLAPLWDTIHNLIAWAATTMESDTVVEIFSQPPGGSALILSGATLAALALAAWKYCRAWCNFCPVGAILGLLSRFSLLRIRLEKNKCLSCGRCEHVCKTGCLNIDKKVVDSSRCVDCFNCLAVCPSGALAYGPRARVSPSPQSSTTRRAFLALAPALLATPVSAAVIAPGRADKLPERKTRPARSNPVTPPGSRGVGHFSAHCSGCQLCASVCPGYVLASFANGLGVAQPSLTFEYGYCLQGCARCGAVCPTGAIAPFTAAEKEGIQIGLANVDFDRCIVHTEKIPCKACYNICPPQAISLEPVPGSTEDLKRPVVDAAKCVGCGACEFVCPARPLAAISVSGMKEHKLINGQ